MKLTFVNYLKGHSENGYKASKFRIFSTIKIKTLQQGSEMNKTVMISQINKCKMPRKSLRKFTIK